MLAALMKSPTDYNPVGTAAALGPATALVLGRHGRDRRDHRRQGAKAAAAVAQGVARGGHGAGAIFRRLGRCPEPAASLGAQNRDLVVETTLDLTAERLAAGVGRRPSSPAFARQDISQAALVSVDGAGPCGRWLAASTMAPAPSTGRWTPPPGRLGLETVSSIWRQWRPVGPRTWWSPTSPVTIDGWSPRNFEPDYLGQNHPRARAGAIDQHGGRQARRRGRPAGRWRARRGGWGS